MPIGISEASIAALDLVPAGLVPVAVFPPFAQTRRNSAFVACVIFSESDDTSIDSANRDGQFRFKRQATPTFVSHIRRNLVRMRNRVQHGFSNWRRSFRALTWNRDSHGHYPDSASSNVRVVPRKYGFRCLIRTTERCFTNDPGCNLSPDDLTPSLHSFLRRQGSGETFSSEGPAECRTTLCPN